MWIQLLFPLILACAAGLLFYAVWAGRRQGAEAIASRGRFALRTAFALALIPSLLLLVVPVYSGLSERATASGGTGTVSEIRGTLIQSEGIWVLVVLLLPIALTAAGLAARAAPQRRTVIRIGAAVLTVFVVLGSFTVGLLYLPAAVALWIAAFVTPSAEQS